MTYRNKWERLLMDGWPSNLDLRAFEDLCEGESEYEIGLAIWCKANNEGIEFVEAAHRILKVALGRERFDVARRAVLKGGEWEVKTLFMCRRAALAYCRSEGATNVVHTLSQIDGMLKSLVISETEMRAERAASQKAWLVKAAPYNRLPC